MARDAAIQDLVDHFHRMEQEWIEAGRSYDLWESLTKRELEAIENEIRRCRDDFVYAAQNYFWIIDKETKQDRLFELWDSQHLILEIMEHLRRKGLSRRVIIIKARQLGISTLAEAMIAHQAMFFRNSYCFVVSYNAQHSAELFAIMQNIYDRMPWWMKPDIWSRKFETGLILDTPPEERRLRPGMNSRIRCSWATAVTGVGQGVSLTGVHLSEFADWEDRKAREIIEEDIENAIVDKPHTFGILESTGKNPGGYAHDLWLRMERLGEKAKWFPVFLPWFFDRNRRLVSVPRDWKPQENERRIRDLAERHWVRCSNGACGKFVMRRFGMQEQAGRKCPFCGQGVLERFLIPDEQLAWWERRRLNVEGSEESLATLRQEQATTADEAFIVGGVRLFSESALRFAESCTRDMIGFGMLDEQLRLHGVSISTGRCFQPGCLINHEDDDPWIDFWQMPQPGATYVIGVDTAEGLGGNHDYSVAQVLRVNQNAPDEQVAVLASNTIDAAAFAKIVYRLGMFYNQAMVAVELNSSSGGVVAHALRIQLQYPNMYRPIRYDTESMESSLIGWKTTAASKPRLYQSLRRALEDRVILIRDIHTVRELQFFRREESSSGRVGAIVGHDDRAMALMIAYTTAHERDWDESGGVLRLKQPLTLETAPFHLYCRHCHEISPLAEVSGVRRCPKCSNMNIVISANQIPQMHQHERGQYQADLSMMDQAVVIPGPSDYNAL